MKDSMNEGLEDQLVEQNVTYTLGMDGKFYVVENVPAMVDEETGEQFFTPSTVEYLQGTILDRSSRARRSKRQFMSTVDS